jgi:hypothetical protein
MSKKKKNNLITQIYEIKNFFIFLRGKLIQILQTLPKIYLPKKDLIINMIYIMKKYNQIIIIIHLNILSKILKLHLTTNNTKKIYKKV